MKAGKAGILVDSIFIRIQNPIGAIFFSIFPAMQGVFGWYVYFIASGDCIRILVFSSSVYRKSWWSIMFHYLRADNYLPGAAIHHPAIKNVLLPLVISVPNIYHHVI